MKISQNQMRPLTHFAPLALSLALFNFVQVQSVSAEDASKPATGSGEMVPLMLKLPAPAFKGTPKDVQLSTYVEPLSDKPRPPMMVPAGMINIAAGAKLTCSEKTDTYEFLSKITEDVKEN